ncbi:MAG: hypothetical protein VW405_08180 [Rhodospirillaceae bacterium]
MPKSADRVKDSTTTEGTGNLTLSGSAPTGFQSFNTAFGTDVRFYYAISSSGSAEWEVGVGYLSAATTLVRETVLESSNSDAAVNLSAGTKDVFCTIPSFQVQRALSRTAALLLSKGNFLP